MKNLFTSYLLLIIFALINSNVVLAQYSNATLNGSRFIYLEPLNPSCFSSENNYNIYPNPNNGTMTLDYIIPESENGEFAVYDLSGKKIISHQLQGGNNTTTISTTELLNGVYFYQITSGNKLISKNKLVIIK